MAQAGLNVGNLELYARKILDTPDPTVKLQLVSEIRDNMDIVNTQDYGLYLKYLFPVFYNTLRQGSPQLQDGPDQKIRNILLEVLSRLPTTDLLRPFAQNLLKLSMYLLEVENEENACICLRIIIDLHKTYRMTLESEVQPFLDIVQKFYNELPKTLAAAFADSNKPKLPQAPAAGGMPSSLETPRATTLIRSNASFKVLTECPIIVVLLFQLYSKFLSGNIQKFMPLIVQTLSLQAPVHGRSTNRVAYVDFVAAQVKTLSFLAYLLRGFSESLRPYQENIPKYVTNLLISCPYESAAIRKELLIATRHILATDFRLGFVSQIDTLLDEKVLIGSGRTSYETLRPLAYSTLADLVHHVRGEMSLNQLARVVSLYARNIHDSTLPFTIQTMSAKLLLNLVEGIAKKNTPDNEGRSLLVKILDAFVNKFSSLKNQLPKISASAAAHSASSATSVAPRDHSTTAAGAAAAAAAASAGPIGPPGSAGSGGGGTGAAAEEGGTSADGPAPVGDLVRDCRLLMKTLVLGLKNIVWGITSCNPSAGRDYARLAAGGAVTATAGAGGVPGAAGATAAWGAAPGSVNKVLVVEESLIFMRLLKNGIKCFQLYAIPPLASPQEEKDILDHFAAVFAMVDIRIFQDVFSSKLNFVFEAMLENSHISEICDQFLLNRSLPSGNVSRVFADLLLTFLMDKLKQLQQAGKTSSMILKLFYLVFESAQYFPDNELVIQPHLPTLINTILKHPTESKDCDNYFVLLKGVYKSIAGSKFDILHKELHPLLPVLLENLNRLLMSSHVGSNPFLKSLLIELALSIPVKLAVLLPHLHYLVRPILMALHSGAPELVLSSLRLLEVAIENVSPQLLQPFLHHKVLPQIALCLWGFLNVKVDKPSSSTVNVVTSILPGVQTSSPWFSIASQSLRVLGKMAGKNRKFMEQSLRLGGSRLGEPVWEEYRIGLHFEAAAESPVSLSLSNTLSQLHLLFLDTHLALTTAKPAFNILKVALTQLLLNRPVESAAVAAQANDAAGMQLRSDEVLVARAIQQLGTKQVALVRRLLQALIHARTNEALRSHSLTFYRQIASHFAFANSTQGTTLAVPASLWTESLIHVLCAEDSREHVSSCIEGLELQWEAMVTTVHGDNRDAAVRGSSMVDDMLRGLCHECDKRDWQAKSGACAAISHLAPMLPAWYIKQQQVAVIKALLNVLKDNTLEYCIATQEDAQKALALLLKLANSANNEQAGEPSPERQQVIAVLTAELSSPISSVRKTVQHLLEQLAEQTAAQVTELLQPHKDLLLNPIFAVKSLRALPVAVQIGYLDALSYCFGLRPPLLGHTPQLFSILQEALTIAEADEVTGKPPAAPPATPSAPAAAPSAASTPAGTPAATPVQPTPATAQTPAPTTEDAMAVDTPAAVASTPGTAATAATPAGAATPAAAPAKPAAPLVQPVTSMKLRISAIELLSAAMAGSELTDQQPDFRNRVTSVFFKALTMRSKEMVQVAKKGLTQAVFQQKMPKDLLQSSLRPVLMNLADPRKVNLPLLQGLARLLELLATAFNITLGEKLLEHLHKHTEMNKLKRDSEDTKVTSTMIELFHLLPPAAVKFLQPLVDFVISMDGAITREVSSPYRASLIKFLNRYPTESIDFFLSHMRDNSYAKLFRFVVRSEAAGAVRDELAKNPAKVVSMFQPVGGISPEQEYQAVAIVRALVKHQPDWLGNHSQVLDVLLDLWRARMQRQRDNRPEEALPLFYSRETKLLIVCLLNYCRAHKNEVNVLFLMLTVFGQRSTIDYQFLRDFYQKEINETYTIEQRRAILAQFIVFFQEPTTTSEHKVQALQVFILPMLSYALNRGDGKALFDQKLLDEFVVPLVDVKYVTDEALTVELVQVLTLLVKHLHLELFERRKEVIKFVWPVLKYEDATAKFCGYIMVSHFIDVYEVPPKIVLQVYATLLRAFQPEGRALVRTALDVLLPALKKKSVPAPNERTPMWAKMTKKILLEEGHSSPQLIHILSLLVRHPNIFYGARDSFSQQIISAIQRIGLQPSAPVENKKLSLDLVDLLIFWEKKRLAEVKEMKEPKKPAATAAPAPAAAAAAAAAAAEAATSAEAALGDLPDLQMPSPSGRKRGAGDMSAASGTEETSPAVKKEKAEGTDGTPTVVTKVERPAETELPADSPLWQSRANQLLEIGANFLVRMALQLHTSALPENQNRDNIALSQTSIDLLKQALALSPEVNISFKAFEKLLSNSSENPHVVATCLNLIKIILDQQLSLFLQHNLPQLQNVILTTLTSDHIKVVLLSCDILGKILKVHPIMTSKTGDVAGFYKRLGEIVDTGLQNYDAKQSAMATITMLKTIAQDAPEYLDAYLPQCVRMLQKLSKDSVTPLDELQLPPLPPSAVPQMPTLPANSTPAQMQAAQQLHLKKIKEAQAQHVQAQFTIIKSSLRTLIQLINMRHTSLAENKKGFLTSLLLLVDKSNDVSLLEDVTAMLATWIQTPATPPQQPFLAMKEKANFLIHMTRFDQFWGHREVASKRDAAAIAAEKEKEREKEKEKEREQKEKDADKDKMAVDAKEPPAKEAAAAAPAASTAAAAAKDKPAEKQPAGLALERQYLELVYSVYNQPTTTRVEMAALEPAFMLGLRSNIPHVRQMFFAVFHKSIARALPQRLNYLLGQQSWEALSGTFWISQALQLVLSVASPSGAPLAIRVGPSSHKAVVLRPASVPSIASRSWAEWIDKSTNADAGAEFVEALRELCGVHDEVAHGVWVDLFPQLYAVIPREDQAKLHKAVATLVSRDYHIKQAMHRPNVVQTLLEGAVAPPHGPIKLAPDVVKFLSKTYNVWHTGILYLQAQVASGERDEKLFDTLAELFEQLNEDDLNATVWAKRPVAFDETRLAVTYQQFGFWIRAQEAYFNAMNKAQSALNIPKAEAALWQSRWIACARRLHQWDHLNEYARTYANPELLVEASWKVNDWAGLKEGLQKIDKSAEHNFKLHQAYLAMHENRISDVLEQPEAMYLQGVAIALKQWLHLPHAPSAAHLPHLHHMQQLVEVAEAAQMLKELGQAQAKHSSLIGDVKSTLQMWRERLPNKHEDIVWWSDVLTWRQGVFQSISLAFQHLADSPVAHLGHHESAWTINKFAHVARKHSLLDVCLNSLHKIYSLPNIEIQDAFVKLKEQVKCHLLIQATAPLVGPLPTSPPLSFRNGLDIINSTNMDYFTAPQKAEFFQLKGDLLHKMRQEDDANTAYSTAVSLYDNLSKAWLQWALFADRQFVLTSADPPRRLTWGENVVACFLQGLRAGSTERRKSAHRYVARLLWLILQDDEGDRLTKAFATALAQMSDQAVPSWLWLPSLPTILAAITTPTYSTEEQVKVCKGLLKRMAHVYPQAIVGGLRAHVSAFGTHAAQAESMLTLLRSAGASESHLVADVEQMYDQLSVAMRPTRVQRTLLALLALNQNLWKKFPTGNDAAQPLPASVESELRAAVEHLSRDEGAPTALDADLRTQLTADLLSAQPRTIQHVHDRIRHWIGRIQLQLTRQPTSVSLESVASALYAFHNSFVELPGNYQRLNSEPASDLLPRVDRFLPDMDLLPLSSVYSPHHRIHVRTTDGRVFSFLADEADDELAMAEERMGGLEELMARILRKHKEARRRHAGSLLTPRRVRLGNKVRLLLMDQPHLQVPHTHTGRGASPLSVYLPQSGTELSVSLENVFEEHCVGLAKDPATLLQLYREKHKEKPTAQAALQFLNDAKSFVPDSLLLSYVLRHLSHPSHLVMYKKQFAQQLAVKSLLGFLFSVVDRSADKICFVPATGQIYQRAFVPTYSAEHVLINVMPYTASPVEVVPWRLSRSLISFLAPLDIDAHLSSTMAAAAVALNESRTQLNPQLMMFFRDELLASKYLKDEIKEPKDAQAAKEVKSKDALRVTANITALYARLQVLTGALFPQPPQQQQQQQQQAQQQAQQAAAAAAASAAGGSPAAPTGPTTAPLNTLGSSTTPISIETKKLLVTTRVTEFIQMAVLPSNLCQMPPAWQPWI